MGQAHQDAELRFLDAALGEGRDARLDDRLKQFLHPVPLHAGVGGDVDRVRGPGERGEALAQVGEALVRLHVEGGGAAHEFDAEFLRASSMEARATSERPSGVSS